ncbi:MAG TPA: flagellar hook-associated protein FlgL [Bacilli bacterium]
MPLRVTQSMITAQLLSNISNNVNKMSNYQNMLSTGRKINRPSDDPVGITYALRYRSEITINDQFQRNVDFAKSAVEHLDTVMGQINDIFQRANELTVQGVNGTNPQTALDAISAELNQLYEQAVTLGNSQLNGKYIFNGQLTDKQPYTSATADTDATDDQTFSLEFAAGVTIPVNVTGNEVFGSGPESLFAILKGLKDSFSAGDQAAARVYLGKLEDRFDKFLEVRAEVGARANRIDMLDSQLESLSINLQKLSGETEDADIAETITKLKTAENVYQASLSVGAKIIQPSLVDYLR